MFGREKAFGTSDWKRRLGYSVLGELHVPGRLRVWHVIKELRRLGYWRRKSVTVLDAGGGEGGFAYYIARKFPTWQVVLVDNSPETQERASRIKEALGLQNLELRQADLREPVGDDLFDLIVCSDVLEHIEEDDLVVSHLARALKPNGIVLLTSPSVPQPKHLPLVAWRERRIGFKPSDYGHVRQGYSHNDMRRIIEKAGLAFETVRWTFGTFGTLMFDLFFVTGDSKPNPAVFAALFPLYIGFSALDVAIPSQHGAGILGVGRKP